jgi:hypothetical protein
MKRRSIAVGGAAVVLAAGIGGGVAYAADSNGPTPHGTAAGSATTATTVAETQQKDTHQKARLARRAVHGELTVKTKQGYRTVLVQRGTISAVSATRITLVSSDHYQHTYLLDAKTRVRIDKQKSSVGKLIKGAMARVVTGPLLGADTARSVVERTR